jgi:lipoprotein-anchoring transpeptidase ErfK/SrfK
LPIDSARGGGRREKPDNAGVHCFATARGPLAASLPNFGRPFGIIISPEQRTLGFPSDLRGTIRWGWGSLMPPHQKPPEMKILLRQHPRGFLRACMTLFCVAAVATLSAGSVAAQQGCFLFFCPPGVQPGWQGPPDRQGEPARPFLGGSDVPFSTMYAESNGEPFPVPALRLSDVDPTYLRRSVYYPTDEQPGTIVIDPQAHFLYLVEGGGRAMRYGVGVGRSGFEWSGVATVHNKQEWPDWYPPKEMIERQPEIKRMMSELQSGLGMHGGPRNPLGARALYLWQGNKDTLFRIHGTVEPWTIGKSVSSGCIRMINQDVIDLYQRTPVGAKVVVQSSRATAWRP